MKRRNRLLAILAFVGALFPSVAWGQFATPILFNNGTRVSPAYPQWNFVGAVPGDVSCVGVNPFITCTFKGGSSTTAIFQDIYNNGVGVLSGEHIVLAAGGGAVEIQDNAVAINAPLFAVEDNTATVKYLLITDNATNQLLSPVANGAGAVAVKIGATNTLTAANATCDVQVVNNGTTLACMSRASDVNNGLKIADTNSFVTVNNGAGTQLGFGTSFVGVQTAITGVTFRVSGTDQWQLDATHLYPQATLSEDIGDATHVVTNTFTNFVDAGTGNALNVGVNSTTGVNLGNTTAKVNFNYATTATGGATTATLGTLGTGPGTAAQNSWLPVTIGGTTGYWIAVWR